MEKVIRKLKEAKERVVKFINGYDTRTKVVAGVASAIVLVLTVGTIVALSTEDAPVASAANDTFESIDIINTSSDETADDEDSSSDRGFNSDENENTSSEKAEVATTDDTTKAETVALPDTDTNSTESNDISSNSKEDNNSKKKNNSSNNNDSKSNNNNDKDIVWVPVYATRTVKAAWDEPVYENQPVYTEVPVVCSATHYTNPGQTIKCNGMHKTDHSDGTDTTVAYDQYLVSGPYLYGDSASNPMPYAAWSGSYNHTDWYHEQEIVGYKQVQTGTEKVQVDTIHHPAVTEEYIDYYYNQDNPSQTKDA